jgi:4-alpha-glucanotransferase
MNRPSTPKDNWEWRLLPEELTSSLEKKLREMTELHERG